LGRTSEASTGVTVKVAIRAPASAKPYVRAMGPKICPSTPCMVKSGMKAATVMATEKNTERSTCSALR
jgi:hypothetical protein